MKSPARRRALQYGLTAGGAALASALASRVIAQAPREIEMTARRFSYVPNEIALKVNEKVVLLIRSIDFVHGFNVPDLALRVDLVPGKITRVELQPRQAGVLDFVCDNFCGAEHEEMHGRFVVSA
ncbi:MAG: cupredoxin domain-containing protein [Burkholderiaceae bacterium]